MTLTETTKATGLRATLSTSSCFRKDKDVIDVTGDSGDQLRISFQRTIRVPDGKADSELPPGMGTFPLYSVANYKDNLPNSMAAKGGLFLPMYRINAISGEPMIENAATRFRRLNLLGQKKSVQDYMVTPEQLWLDGIASNDGRVRQFVAVPLGSGYSVEAQMTGEDVLGGIQFEITPAIKPPPPPMSSMRPFNNKMYPFDPKASYPATRVFVRTLVGKIITLSNLSGSTTIDGLRSMVYAKEGIPEDQQRLIFRGMQLEGGYSLEQYGIPDEATLIMVLRLRGGGPPAKEMEMGIAPGGLIKQCILEDENPASIWDRERSICFNVQVLNSDAFHHVTGVDPPGTPISAQTYAAHGLPFYKIYNETSTIKGDFGNIKSVKTIDKAKASENSGCEDHDEPSYKNPVIMLNPQGISVKFRPVSELEKELLNMNHVQF